MVKFYPPFFPDEAPRDTAGQKAETAVMEALSNIDDRWIVFRGLEWRDLDDRDGERRGETDAVVFHPDLGILFIEIKSQGIKCENGTWFHESTIDVSCKEMKMSPFSQARRNFFALRDKLKRTSLANDILEDTAITYTLWFPDITWNAPIPPDAPNSAFILDSRNLKNTATSLRSILTQSKPHSRPWSKYQIEILLRTLCPDVNLVPPLGVKLGELHDRLFKLTKSQVSVLMSLRKQKQLLVEGCAGSGKTLLAAQLAREHALEGKKVLFVFAPPCAPPSGR